MRLGIALRNMGPQSAPETLGACARHADAAGLDSLWVADHLAIPPEDAEGSDGRYLEPLATLAFLAAATRRIGLGTGVLVLPYRPALLAAKQVATVQELSGGRLLLGVGVGWMEPEFRALGVPRRRRGALTDAGLALLERCFAADEVEANGQRFLFRPRPPRPPVLVGGAPPHALLRAARSGEGWMPVGLDAEALRGPVAELRRRFAEAGRPTPEVVTYAALPLDAPDRALRHLHVLAEAGVTRVVHAAGRYDEAGFCRAVDRLAELAGEADVAGNAG